MSEPYGYKSERDFLKAIERELREMSSHDSGARDREREQSQTRLKGKPGSRERWQQAASIAGDRQLVNAAAQDANADALVRSVRTLQRDGLSLDEISRAVKLTLAIDRADVALQVWQALPDGVADVFEDQLGTAFAEREQTREKRDEQAERKRLADREALLQREYDLAATHSEDAVDAVDATAQQIGPEALYDENVDPDQLRAAMRAAGVQAGSQRDALGQLASHAALDEEFKRIGAPGSSWTDDERARWEEEMTASSVEAAERHLLTPDQAATAAVESMQPTRTFESQLDEELAKYQPPEHADRLRDAAVDAWERENPDKK